MRTHVGEGRPCGAKTVSGWDPALALQGAVDPLLQRPGSCHSLRQTSKHNTLPSTPPALLRADRAAAPRPALPLPLLLLPPTTQHPT